MVNQLLVDYLKKYLPEGYSKDDIYDYFIKQGYNPDEVREAFNVVQSGASLGSVTQPSPAVLPKQTSTPVQQTSQSSDVSGTKSKNSATYVFIAIAGLLFFVVISFALFKFYVPSGDASDDGDSSLEGSSDDSYLSDRVSDDDSGSTGHVVKQQLGSFSLEESESMTDEEFLGKAIDDLHNLGVLDSFEASMDIYQLDGTLSMTLYWNFNNKDEEAYCSMSLGTFGTVEMYAVDGIIYTSQSPGEWSTKNLDSDLIDLFYANDFSFIAFKEAVDSTDSIGKIGANEETIGSGYGGVNYYYFEFKGEAKDFSTEPEYLIKFNTDLMFIESMEINVGSNGEDIIYPADGVLELIVPMKFEFLNLNEDVSINLPAEALSMS